jgi:hypothetical protein
MKNDIEKTDQRIAPYNPTILHPYNPINLLPFIKRAVFFRHYSKSSHER